MITKLMTLLVSTGLLLAGTPAPVLAAEGHCAGQERIRVPGAERQELSCLDDLTTAGTVASGHTVPADWAGLSSVRTVNPAGVAGIQVDGYFSDTSTTNANHGWNHDAQFVLRLPDQWNGKLIVTGAPGVRRQYALDATISDWVLGQGYAFAATDKGNTGVTFYRDGAAPGDAVAEWNRRVTELTIAAKTAVLQRYGRVPGRTYMTGLSNGGYLTRWQLENRPGLYDGGVDWEGTLFRADGPNLFTYLPTALRSYPVYRGGSAAAHEEMLRAGFAPGSEFLWEFHYQVYWDLTQRIYREEFDPSYDGDTEAGTPFCAGGTPACDADYDYFSRPAAVHQAVRKVELTGRIGKPLLTLHGTLDSLLPPATDSDVYTQLVRGQGRGGLHRYYVIEDGNHVDGLYDVFPAQLRPVLPCYRDALTVLDRWVSDGERPPASGTVPRPAAGDLANSCSVAQR
ncbi:MAG TPA: tannase/feruloyl esterase family alpha/beta hydrolase [Kribbellaceae bacterium]|nr:tannase/feruloyl esterase family alpha/beta hydrolase [Kribbellaceae bacterium]